MYLNRLRVFARLSAVRLTLSLLLVFAVVTTFAWVGTFWLVQREMNRLVDARLQAQMAEVSEAVRTGQTLPQPSANQEVIVVSNGIRTGFLPFPVPDLPDGPHNFDPGRQRDAEFRFLVRNTPDGRIIVAENVERHEELREVLAGGMQVSLFGTLIIGMLSGLWLARREQHRLNVIGDGLAQVARGRLETRISLPGRPDDLSLLADRINATTARLELTMEQMRVQSSNIAHDLRTPLARLRAQVETNLIDLTEKNRAVRADELEAAIEQIDHISETFNALLRLARIESGAGKAAFGPVDLDALVRQVAETFGPVIEDGGQTLRLDIENPERIVGDHDLIVQMIANLIQNAMRYGPSGQEITLGVHGAHIFVSDQGPGIPFAQREKVLQPLFQLENARQNVGFGLGLSIVQAISALHEAQLSLADGPQGRGLTVSVRFSKLTKM
ncbi:HAMP domain-containing sensor histidine kinase [uncultured Pelagimonas sp.]|uniref:sensor histidine kinase n=1 Tax=uncultured Pelagimonas sp. TaxID=1618102 RepID=UPI002628F18D|nr:HAMP domain-containing sensor histidine kinase [uncultured Pelagimonas sp.]